MADKEEPEVEEADGASTDEESGFAGRNLFGIDLGRRGDRAEQTSRDEVDAPPPPKREKAATRTLSDRLASAASDRNDAANREKDDDPESEDD